MIRIALLFFVVLSSPALASGPLVIAGGAVAEDNDAVWRAFAERLTPDGPVFIIAGASGSPVQSAASAKRALIAVGVDQQRLKLAPLAVRDDDSTSDVDEAGWANNASNLQLAEDFQGAAGFWFTGGDQSRLTALLLQKGSNDTPTLAALRTARTKGAVVGGTSAGAAIMSRLMIAGGTSLDALLGQSGRRSGDGFQVAQGLGFLKVGVADQHFGQRARLGRLIRAVGLLPDTQHHVGYGVDEGTALIVDQDGLEVVGEGYVTVVDASRAEFSVYGSSLSAKDIRLHLLANGDTMRAEDRAIAVPPYKKPTLGDEYNDQPPVQGGGMALGDMTLASVIGGDLLDNKRARRTEHISFDENGDGIRYVFRQTRESRGYWGRDMTGTASYTLINVAMDIEPVDVIIRPKSKR